MNGVVSVWSVARFGLGRPQQSQGKTETSSVIRHLQRPLKHQRLNWHQQALRFGKKLKILITAGATKEKIDGVRFITLDTSAQDAPSVLTNFSSGAFGRAFGIEALKRGHEVTLLAPKELPKIAGPLTIALSTRLPIWKPS